jgi:hypothetical protein
MDRETKLAKIAAIRDTALQIMQERGQWRGEGKDRHMSADVGDCSIAYRTPFQNDLHPVPEEMRYWAALVGRRVDFGYGLDVWFQRKKVLNVMWDGDDMEIVSFKPGEWEWLLRSSPKLMA